MAPMIPDCGIFTTPRREPPLRALVEAKDDVAASPRPATTPLGPHRLATLALALSPGSSEITLESGLSFGFYKSAKSLFSRTHAAPPPANPRPGRRPRDGINKGVGHNIKKPKPKAKERLKKTNDVKTITKRLKEGAYTPYLPSSRSPVKKTPVSAGGKRRRILSSPGMSLLEVETDEEFVPETKDVKFFTSRSRATATVHIGRNIKLTAKYGDVSLKQREGGFVKKNVGRRVEDELHQYLQQADGSASDEKVESLPSVQVNPRPAPTRVPATPSPTRKSLVQRRPHTSPLRTAKKISVAVDKKNGQNNNTEEENRHENVTDDDNRHKNKADNDKTQKKNTDDKTRMNNTKEKDTKNEAANNAGHGDKSFEGELLDMEALLADWDDSTQESDKSGVAGTSPTKMPRDEPEGISTPRRKSPRKTCDCGTPGRRVSVAPGVCGSPVRRSPRKPAEGTPSRRMARKLNGCESPARSPSRAKTCSTPTRRSPRKLSVETPSRRLARKVAECSSPSRSPSRGRNCPTPRRSPRKSDSGTPSKRITKIDSKTASPRRQTPVKGNGVVKSAEKPTKPHRSEATPKESSKAVKMFPIFDPKRRLSDHNSPSVPGKSSARFHNKVEDTTQMIIDAGQRRFGAEQCADCGIVYEVGSLADEASHRHHHERCLSSLKFTGWKRERLVRNVDIEGGRILMVTRDDPEHCWRKVEDVREVIDNELGFSENRPLTRDRTKVFMKVLNNQIVGVLIAERIAKAYRIVPQKLGRLACCSETPSKVWGGVSRIWVLQSQRGKRIASLLVDCMRENMIPNYILTVDQIAFSDPTEAGMMFAERYTKKPDFLVYRRNL